MRSHLLAPFLLLAPLALPLAAGPAGTLVVLNKSDASAWLDDPETGVRLASVPTGEGPHEADVTPDGRLAVVTNYGGKTPGGALALVRLAAGTAAGTSELAEDRPPHGITPQRRHPPCCRRP